MPLRTPLVLQQRSRKQNVKNLCLRFWFLSCPDTINARLSFSTSFYLKKYALATAMLDKDCAYLL